MGAGNDAAVLLLPGSSCDRSGRGAAVSTHLQHFLVQSDSLYSIDLGCMANRTMDLSSRSMGYLTIVSQS